MASKVAVLRTTPETILDDIVKVMETSDAARFLTAERELLLKLNLSWTKYFPACSSQPWQLDGILKYLLGHGYAKEQLLPIENKTVVTNPHKGARNNLWMPILDGHGIPFTALPEVEWIVYEFRSELLRLNQIFPEGIKIPKMFVGRDILVAPM